MVGRHSEPVVEGRLVEIRGYGQATQMVLVVSAWRQSWEDKTRQGDLH